MSDRSKGRKLSERQSPEDFFNAAIKILAADGPERLNIPFLCARLGVTKGSFYHHFASFDDFVVALMGAWNAALTKFMERVEAENPARTLELVLQAMASMPHETEGAVRAWARTNPTVAAAVRLQDEIREAKAREWLSRFVEDPERCRVLAHMKVCLLAGMQERPPPLDRELILAACIELARLFGAAVQVETSSVERRFQVCLPTLDGG
jgi:AcrR family transcriptional regulator